jgi:hypothetical protein
VPSGRSRRPATVDRARELYVPDPDLATATLADAVQLGGPEFVAEVRADATAVADELAPSGPDDVEPAHRESAWTGAAWTLVDAARAALVGQVVPTASGGAWTVTPARCPAGHPHRAGRVLAGWRPCRCGGHHTWACLAELADGTECGAETVVPEPGEGCRAVRAW